MDDMAAAVDQWLDAYGRNLGARLRLSPEHTVAWSYADGLTLAVELSPTTGDLSLRSSLGSAPVEGAGRLFARLLSAHCLGRETAGASFCLDPQTSEILLCCLRPVDKLDAAGFSRLVDALVGSARRWRDALQAPSADATSPDEALGETASSSPPGEGPGFWTMV